jgi:hypothetical protein
VRLRARSPYRFAPLVIHVIPDSLTYLVSLFLKRQCDRTLGQHSGLHLQRRRLAQHPRRGRQLGCHDAIHPAAGTTQCTIQSIHPAAGTGTCVQDSCVQLRTPSCTHMYLHPVRPHLGTKSSCSARARPPPRSAAAATAAAPTTPAPPASARAATLARTATSSRRSPWSATVILLPSGAQLATRHCIAFVVLV